MSIFDGWKAREQDKKLETSKQKVLEKQDVIDFQKLQKKMREKIKTKEELDKLKELVNTGIISKESIENIISGEILSTGEIKEILEKIDEIGILDKENKVLPKNFTITKQEYLDALTNFDKKVVLLEKIDASLDYIYQNMGGGGLTFSLISFLGYSLILSKSTQKIQSNLIDIKNDILNTKTL